MSHLNRIIAVDNISRGQFVEIPTIEHTNFNGVIRAGKTTTLRAALLFYGTRPGDIAKAKGDAFEGFATFYFPRPSSFLVYEYIKGDKTYCVVCSGKKNQVQYQFLDTAFEQSYFLHNSQGITTIVDTAQLRVFLEAKGFELTAKIGSETYAKVIQSNKRYRGKGANAEQIRRLRPKYSLPANGGSIENIDRVLSNIFSSKASVANIRSALTNILVQEGLISSRTLTLDEHAGQIGDWFDSREAWMDLENRREVVFSLAETAAGYQGVTNNLSGLMGRCNDIGLR